MTTSFLDRVREFAARELIGRDREFDTPAGKPPFDIYRSFHEAGLSYWWMPEEHGGPHLSIEQSVDVISEIAYGDAGIAFALFSPFAGSIMLSLFGTDDHYTQYVLPAAAEGRFMALAGSEHAAGSELTRIETSAALRGDEVVINGLKAFCTNADYADFLLVFTRDADEPDLYRTVLVPRDTVGITINKHWEVIGLRTLWTYEVAFTDCRVPIENVLAAPGLRVLEAGINALRIFIGCTALGVSRRIRDLCMDYGAGRRLRAGTLLDNAVFEARLGQMEMEIDVMRNQCRAAGRELDELLTRPDAAHELLRRGTLRSSVGTKMFCGQTGWNIASIASEMFGGLGYTEELPINKYLRDIRFASLLDGGNEVLRQLIYKRYVIPEFRRI